MPPTLEVTSKKLGGEITPILRGATFYPNKPQSIPTELMIKPYSKPEQILDYARAKVNELSDSMNQYIPDVTERTFKEGGKPFGFNEMQIKPGSGTATYQSIPLSESPPETKLKVESLYKQVYAEERLKKQFKQIGEEVSTKYKNQYENDVKEIQKNIDSGIYSYKEGLRRNEELIKQYQEKAQKEAEEKAKPFIDKESENLNKSISELQKKYEEEALTKSIPGRLALDVGLGAGLTLIPGAGAVFGGVTLAKGVLNPSETIQGISERPGLFLAETGAFALGGLAVEGVKYGVKRYQFNKELETAFLKDELKGVNINIGKTSVQNIVGSTKILDKEIRVNAEQIIKRTGKTSKVESGSIAVTYPEKELIKTDLYNIEKGFGKSSELAKLELTNKEFTIDLNKEVTSSISRNTIRKIGEIKTNIGINELKINAKSSEGTNLLGQKVIPKQIKSKSSAISYQVENYPMKDVFQVVSGKRKNTYLTNLKFKPNAKLKIKNINLSEPTSNLFKGKIKGMPKKMTEKQFLKKFTPEKAKVFVEDLKRIYGNKVILEKKQIIKPIETKGIETNIVQAVRQSSKSFIKPSKIKIIQSSSGSLDLSNTGRFRNLNLGNNRFGNLTSNRTKYGDFVGEGRFKTGSLSPSSERLIKRNKETQKNLLSTSSEFNNLIKNPTKEKELIITTPIIKEGLIERQTQKPALMLRMKQRQVYKNQLSPNFKLEIPPIKIKPNLELPSSDLTNEFKQERGFIPLIKRRKKWIPLTIKPLSKTEAIRKGSLIAKETLAASFKLKESGFVKPSSNQIPNLPEFRSYRISKGKRIPLSNEWIQLRGKRLSSLGEKLEIQLARKK